MCSYSLLSARSKSIKQVSSLKGKEEDYGGSGDKGVFKDTRGGIMIGRSLQHEGNPKTTILSLLVITISSSLMKLA